MIHLCEDIQRREREILAPYAVQSSETGKRKYPENPSLYRTPFQRDRDRIIHSAAFRRLEYKTQVFVNHEGDHYRTRLTHTLEVAQISRSIARALGLNEDLVEAIALSHDLGHPPFGHAGEDALDELMQGSGGFNHNRQSLRVVDELEHKYPEYVGLNLSWEIRESIAKHGKIGPGIDVDEEFKPDWCPNLEAQLADLADSLAYNSHDIDDGLRANFIGHKDLKQVQIWAEIEEEVRKEYNVKVSDRTFTARMVSRLIDRQVKDLLESTLARLEVNNIHSIGDVRKHGALLVGYSPEMEKLMGELMSFLSERLYQHYRTLKAGERAKRFIARIFEEYRREPKQLPPDHLQRAESEGVDRAICDYIAGMTDRYCQDEFKRLFHPFERM